MVVANIKIFQVLTEAPYRSNNGPPIRLPEKRKKTCTDPIQEILDEVSLERKFSA